MELLTKTRLIHMVEPDGSGEVREEELEYRVDPLTGSRTQLNVRRADRGMQAQGDGADLDDLADATREDCPFCPESISRKTPLFSARFVPQGRLVRGQCTVFPNKFPFAEHHAVGTLTSHHFLHLGEFSPAMIDDNLATMQEFLRALVRASTEALYPTWTWNHLPPSAASMVHPHTQTLADREAPPGLRDIIERSRAYYERHGTSFWQDLIDEEKRRGERLIGENEALVAVATFAPHGNREVQFVFKEARSILDVSEAERVALAGSLHSVLQAYADDSVQSFNLLSFSAPVGFPEDHFRLSIRMVSRPSVDFLYTSDCGLLEQFLDTWIVETQPEEVCRTVRPFFR